MSVCSDTYICSGNVMVVCSMYTVFQKKRDHIFYDKLK